MCQGMLLYVYIIGDNKTIGHNVEKSADRSLIVSSGLLNCTTRVEA